MCSSTSQVEASFDCLVHAVLAAMQVLSQQDTRTPSRSSYGNHEKEGNGHIIEAGLSTVPLTGTREVSNVGWDRSVKRHCSTS